jgi:hypothetical protein
MTTTLVKSPSTAIAALNGPATWDTVKFWADTAAKLGHAFTAAQVMAGFALIELRKAHGNQGKRTDIVPIDASKMSDKDFKKVLDKVAPTDGPATSPSNLEKLNWPDAVKKHAGVSDETARTWIKMAEGVRAKWKKLAPQEQLKQLMSVPPGDWTEKETKLVCESVQKATDGMSQTEFLRELGIAKKAPGNLNAKGGSKKKLSMSEEVELRKRQAAAQWDAISRMLDAYRDKFVLLSDADVLAQMDVLELALRGRRKWVTPAIGKRDSNAIAELFKQGFESFPSTQSTEPKK